MYRQNSHAFPLEKNPLQYGPSLIRTTDTKSRPLGANSCKLKLFITDNLRTRGRWFAACTISCRRLHKHWQFICQRYQCQNVSKCSVFKTDIYNYKFSKGRTIRNNRRWGVNSPKKIPARETCLKKIIRAWYLKKKFL